MRRKILIFVIVVSLLMVVGCSTDAEKDVEKVISESFGLRAEAVFKYQDKNQLTNYFSKEALKQSKPFMEWKPNGPWENVKDLKYSYSLRISDIEVDGKIATAEVFDTAVVTWDYVDPNNVIGTQFIKEDAWANRKHEVIVILNSDGKWIIDQDKFDMK